jgi:hypothetical protein
VDGSGVAPLEADEVSGIAAVDEVAPVQAHIGGAGPLLFEVGEYDVTGPTQRARFAPALLDHVARHLVTGFCHQQVDALTITAPASLKAASISRTWRGTCRSIPSKVGSIASRGARPASV